MTTTTCIQSSNPVFASFCSACESLQPTGRTRGFGSARSVSVIVIDDVEYPIRDFRYCLIKYYGEKKHRVISSRVAVDDVSFLGLLRGCFSDPSIRPLLGDKRLEISGAPTQWIASFVNSAETVAEAAVVPLVITKLVELGKLVSDGHDQALLDARLLLLKRPSGGRQTMLTEVGQYLVAGHLLNDDPKLKARCVSGAFKLLSDLTGCTISVK